MRGTGAGGAICLAELPAALPLRAAARAVGATPEVNGFQEGGAFCPGQGAHVGWAVAPCGGGLIAPAIRHADRLELDAPMAALREGLAGIAPKADLATLREDDDLREALDLDSMDFRNLVSGLHERTRQPIPEADYPRLFTLAGILACFAETPGG